LDARDDARKITVTETETTIRAYIATEMGRAPIAELQVDTPMLEDDLLDSVGVYEVVVFLEEHYGIEILDEEMVPENFGTISLLAKLVETKR
jgi:acyl carrier protein